MLLFLSDGPAWPKGNGGSWYGPLGKSEWPPPDPRPQPGPDPGLPPPPNPQPPSPPMGGHGAGAVRQPARARSKRRAT
jgi:hypothetical protein